MMTAGIRLLFCLCFLIGTGDAGSDPNQADHLLTRNSHAIRQQIERQRMSAIEPNQPTRADTLKQVVNQLQSLQLSVDSAGLSAIRAVEKTKEDKKVSAQALSQAKMGLSPGAGDKQESGAVQPVSLTDIEKPVNAMAAADALYQAKDYRHAVRFYRIAAQDAGKDDPAGSQWALYQTANCLRYEDAEKAIAAYQRLIAEYPSSAWATAALIQQRNLEWMRKNQPVLSQTKTNNDPNQ
jgi:tetratricopeptide (TPR) repeat protein